MSEVKVNKISPRTNCGTTTLGDSGDSFVIPSGVTITNNGTQTGFGREGSVNWQTGSIKTATFTATSGEGYFCNTTAGVFTVNLPSSPSAGNIVAVSDYAQTFSTNNLTIGRGGSNIEGDAADLVLDAEGLAMTFVYVDATKGWKVVGAGREQDKTTKSYVTATGGTITEDGNFKVHTFNSPGTFCVSCAGNASGSSTVNYLVVAGGAGGGQRGGGGGGAGGHRSNFPADATSGLSVSAQAYPITVGGGGAGAAGSPGGNIGSSGVNSVFSSITSAGGGGGGRWPGSGVGDTGVAGGSGGGGGSGFGGNIGGPGGAGNTPPVSPPQGNNGGSAAGVASPSGCGAGAGGGGAGAVGGNTPGVGVGGAGGAGAANAITGSPVTRAGGGGGGAETTAGAAGPGGGGAGTTGSSNGNAGTTNTGGGGGGARNNTDGGSILGGNGGSGVVIIRYKFQN